MVKATSEDSDYCGRGGLVFFITYFIKIIGGNFRKGGFSAYVDLWALTYGRWSCCVLKLDERT